MADFYFSMLEMTPAETLSLLAAFTQESNGDPAYLRDTFLTVSASAFGANVNLHVLDVKKGKGKREKQRNMNLLLDLYHTRYSREARRDKELPTASEPFVNGLSKLLILSASGDTPSEVIEHRALYIADQLDVKRVAEIADDLQRYGTQFKIAATDSYYLFFTFGDPERKSALRAADAGQFFSDLRRLDAHTVAVQHQQFQLFCPPDLALGYRAAQAFCSFALAAKGLWEPSEHEVANGPLAAIDRGVDNVLRVLYLGRLRWLNELDLSPDARRVESAEIVSLTDSRKAMENLRHAIEEVDDRIGYRLELRPTRYRNLSAAQRQQLELRRIEIENQLAYIDSLSKPRLRLLRFEQEQLPALADLLRSLDVRLLRDGSIRYAFQASEPRRQEREDGADFFPHGVHYLLVGSEVSQSQLSRLSWWAEADAQPMSYWLDPFWARYYHRYENECLIFTPEKTLLYPLMHSWHETEFDDEAAREYARQHAISMDVYMRELISEEFTGERGSFGVPDLPIYLFSGATGRDAMLSLWVLDKAKFEPLVAKLGWINDNLALLDPARVEGFIEGMADAEKRESLAARLEGRARSAEQALTTTSLAVGATFQDMLTGIPTVLTETFEKLIADAVALTGDAHALNERLEAMRTLYAEMEQLTTRTEQQISDTDRRVNQQLQQHSETWTARVQASIDKAEATRKRLELDLANAIYEIAMARDRMRQRLERPNGRRTNPYPTDSQPPAPAQRQHDASTPPNERSQRSEDRVDGGGIGRMGADPPANPHDPSAVEAVVEADQTVDAAD